MVKKVERPPFANAIATSLCKFAFDAHVDLGAFISLLVQEYHHQIIIAIEAFLRRRRSR